LLGPSELSGADPIFFTRMIKGLSVGVHSPFGRLRHDSCRKKANVRSLFLS
jgi:hypothetical protein